MTIAAEQPTEFETGSRNDWQPALSAIQTLNLCDVAVIQRAVADSNEELSELREALAVVERKLERAERERAVIDQRLKSIYSLAALVRQMIDHNAEFACVHSINAEAAIENVKPLKQFAR